VGSFLDPRGRIRGMRFIGIVGEAAAINTALRVASGDCFIVVRAGTELPPQHFERVLAPIAAGQALAVRTPAVAVIHGTDAGGAPQFERHDNLFMPPSESRLSFIAPFGPMESLVFTRAAVDLAQPFNERLPAFTVWEFLLRLQVRLPVAAVDSPAIVHAVAGSTEVYDQCAALPAVVRAIHAAFSTEDASVRIEREAYLRNLQRALERGPAACASAGGVAELLQAANGTDLLAAT
jgi:hypothetical protein